MLYRIEGYLDRYTPEVCAKAIGGILHEDDKESPEYPPHNIPLEYPPCRCFLAPLNSNRGIITVDGIELDLTDYQAKVIETMFSRPSDIHKMTIKEFLGVSMESNVEIKGWVFEGVNDIDVYPVRGFKFPYKSTEAQLYYSRTDKLYWWKRIDNGYKSQPNENFVTAVKSLSFDINWAE